VHAPLDTPQETAPASVVDVLVVVVVVVVVDVVVVVLVVVEEVLVVLVVVVAYGQSFQPVVAWLWSDFHSMLVTTIDSDGGSMPWY
jgi:hypothetical protein